MVNETLVELVRFSEAGLDELIGNTKALEDAIKAAVGQSATLNRALSDPATRKAAGEVRRLADENRRLLDLEGKRADLENRAGRLRSGAFARDVAESGRLRRDEGSVSRLERRTELQTTHGRLAGGALYGLERARPGLLAAGAVGGSLLAMGKSGLSGTVEGHALSVELHLLNREIGNALVPAIREMTSVVRFIRQHLEKLTPGQQDALGYGAIGLAGVGALGAIGGPLAKGAGMLRTGLGKIGLLGGGAAGGAGFGQIAAETAAGGIFAQGVANKGGALAGGAAQGSRLGRFARGAGSFGLRWGARIPFLTAGAALLDDQLREGPSWYTLARKAGANKGMALLTSGASSIDNWLELSGESDMDRKRGFARQHKFDLAALDGGHRSSLIANAGFEDFDTAFQRVATEVALMDAQNRETSPVQEQKKTNEKLDGIHQTLKESGNAKKTDLPPIH